jgi:serine/threonine protein kinase
MTHFQPIQFGKYQLIDKIGLGGMAEVFIGRMTGEKGFEKLLVIKKLLPHLGENDEWATFFIDEAKLAALLQHDNIVHVYDFGKIQESYYIAMEYLFGKDLEPVMSRTAKIKQALPLDIVLYIISKICDGLDYAHRLRNLKGDPLHIIHRDISPQNIFITYDGQVRIIDFGIAKTADQSTKTQMGIIKGKVAYMSPEQAGGQAIDHRSDVFSVGIVLYEMITGKRMFSGNTVQILSRVKTIEFEPPDQIVRDLPPKLVQILHRSLARNPDDRYQTCGAMLSDVEDCLYQLSLRPNARTVSRFMKTLFEKEYAVEKASLVQMMQQMPRNRSTSNAHLASGNTAARETEVIRPDVTGSQDPQGPSNTAGATVNGTPRRYGKMIGIALAAILAMLIFWAWPAKDPTAPGDRHASIQTEITQRTQRLLLQAREAFIAYNLTTPPQASAYHYYNEVLRYDPQNPEALKGLREIADRYAHMADEQMKLFQYEKAQQYIEKGLMIIPDHPQLLALEKDANENFSRRVLKSFKRIFR